jgi:hypothetical protein
VLGADDPIRWARTRVEMSPFHCIYGFHTLWRGERLMVIGCPVSSASPSFSSHHHSRPYYFQQPCRKLFALLYPSHSPFPVISCRVPIQKLHPTSIRAPGPICQNYRPTSSISLATYSTHSRPSPSLPPHHTHNKDYWRIQHKPIG